MRITLTITKKSPLHITFQVFVNGGLSGSLILRREEFEQFCTIMQPDRIRDDEHRPNEDDATLSKPPMRECLYCHEPTENESGYCSEEHEENRSMN